jgi:hypothetical protein
MIQERPPVALFQPIVPGLCMRGQQWFDVQMLGDMLPLMVFVLPPIYIWWTFQVIDTADGTVHDCILPFRDLPIFDAGLVWTDFTHSPPLLTFTPARFALCGRRSTWIPPQG